MDIDLCKISEWERRGYVLTRQHPALLLYDCYMIQGIFKIQFKEEKTKQSDPQLVKINLFPGSQFLSVLER